MERVGAPIAVEPVTAGPNTAGLVGVYEPNFGLLAADDSWRSTWSTIVSGKFSPSPYSGLLFVEQFTAYAELYETDGYGRLRTPCLGKFPMLGERTSWTHIVPGLFGPSGFTGLLLYDQAAGFGCLYDSDGKGHFDLLSEYSGWRTTWSHIVTGRFTYRKPVDGRLAAPCLYSSVFFYSASENYAEIWATDGNGLVDGNGLGGEGPHQEIPNFSSSTFTHVLAGDFLWTPGYITESPTLTDLFCYDSEHGHGEMYRCALVEQETGKLDPADPSVARDSQIVPFPSPAAKSDSLPKQATSVVAGNFGGSAFGDTDLAFYDGPSGSLTFYSFNNHVDGEHTDGTWAELEQGEVRSGLPSSVGLIVPGTFRLVNSEDHWFNDGPAVSGPPPYDPDWRFGTGAFSDLLLYDKEAGLGEFYFHEPLAPPIEPLAGYITSHTSHDGATPVSTGSVLPGEALTFHVSSQCGPYSIAIYQLGAFADGTTERMLATVEELPSAPTPFPIGRTAYRDGAGWPEVASFVIPDWPSGLYLARVQSTGTEDKLDLPFVVRAAAGSETGVVIALSDTTYNAYNLWGGRSLYGGGYAPAFPSASSMRVPFGFQLSFQRPLPDGAVNAVQMWELPFIEWLARRDIPVNVCTARDVHFGYLNPDACRLALFVGHHEYWTAEMRASVEAFGKAGGNVAFFAGNTCWWQIRLSPGGDQLVCYKVEGFDPVATTPDRGLTTIHWFEDPVKRPETTLTGVSWYDCDVITSGPGSDSYRFSVEKPDHWVFADTGLGDGAAFGEYISGTGDHRSVVGGATESIGCEIDRAQQGGPNGMTSPPEYTLASVYLSSGGSPITTDRPAVEGLVRLADRAEPVEGLVRIADREGEGALARRLARVTQPTVLEIGTMGEFSPESGSGVVFNAATTNWALGLSQDQHGWNAIDQITANVISRLGGYRASRPWTPVPEASATPGAQTMPGAPVTVVLTAAGEVSLFLADPQGGVYTCLRGATGGWGEWTSVSEGSTMPGAPVTAVLTAAGEVSLFLADPQGGVYTCLRGATGGWGEWTSVSEGSTIPGAPVTVVLTAAGEVSLFLADPQGGVYTCLRGATGGWGEWTSVSEGSTMPGAPVTAVLTAAGEVSLFLADPQGGVYTCLRGATGGWGEWTSVSEGSTIPGAPVTAVLTAAGEVSLFLADPQGGVYTCLRGATGGWGEWTSVSEGSTMPGAPVTAVLTAAGEVSLFLADPQGGVYTCLRGATGGWGEWTPVPQTSATPGAPTMPGAPVSAMVTAPGEVSLFLAGAEGSVCTTTVG